MKFSQGVWFLAAGVWAAFSLTSPAQAGTKVQGTLVPLNVGGTCGVSGSDPCYTISKPGKFAMKESKTAGGGGIEIQLNLKGVDCPTAGGGNDGGKSGKCNDVNHVLESNSQFQTIVTQTGILFDLVKGKAVFQATGKNKVTGGDIFGALVAAVQGEPLGVGIFRVRGPGSNGADCLQAPLPPDNGCIDGELYAVSGIIASDAAGTAPPPCGSDADCSITQTCTGGTCVNRNCSQDADCPVGEGVTSTCNEATGTCCLANLDTDPECDVD